MAKNKSYVSISELKTIAKSLESEREAIYTSSDFDWVNELE